jgi:SAM-dependent methyltransferase
MQAVPMRELTRLTANGRFYRVMEGPSFERYLRVGHSQTVQSIGGYGPTGHYYDHIADACGNNPSSVLICGLAGGTVARLLRERGYKGKIYGVDNDPTMVSLGRAWFNLDRYVNSVIVMDAERYLRTVAVTFGCVILDLYVDAVDCRHTPDVLRLGLSVVEPGGNLIINDWSQEEGNTVTVMRR